MTLDELEARLTKLEAMAHAPFDFTELVARVERLEQALGDHPPGLGDVDIVERLERLEGMLVP